MGAARAAGSSALASWTPNSRALTHCPAGVQCSEGDGAGEYSEESRRLPAWARVSGDTSAAKGDGALSATGCPAAERMGCREKLCAVLKSSVGATRQRSTAQDTTPWAVSAAASASPCDTASHDPPISAPSACSRPVGMGAAPPLPVSWASASASLKHTAAVAAQPSGQGRPMSTIISCPTACTCACCRQRLARGKGQAATAAIKRSGLPAAMLPKTRVT